MPSQCSEVWARMVPLCPSPPNTHTPVGSAKCWQSLCSRGQCVTAGEEKREKEWTGGDRTVQDRRRHQLAMATYPHPVLAVGRKHCCSLNKEKLKLERLKWVLTALVCPPLCIGLSFHSSLWVAILNAWNKHQSSHAGASLYLLCLSDGTTSWRRGDRMTSSPDKWKCSCLGVTWNWTHLIAPRVKTWWFFVFNYTGEAFRQWFNRVSIK